MHTERMELHKDKMEKINRHKDIGTLFETKEQRRKREMVQRLALINTANLKNNYGNDFTEYLKLF